MRKMRVNKRWMLPVCLAGAYDAGTEVNSKTADSIPGPAAGGGGV